MSIWLGNKRLDSVDIIRSGHNIGDIFYTTRTDEALAGAVECNGGTYSTADYTGAGSIGELLAGGKLDYISLSDYATAISTKGYCDKIGWDGTGTTSFRVPKLAPRRYVIKEQKPTEENNYTWYRLYNDGWVEQGGRVGPYSHTFNGTYSTSYSPTTVSFPIEMQDTRFYKTATSMHASVFASIYDQTTTDAKIGLGSVNVALSGIYATWEVIGQSAIVSDPTERAMFQLFNTTTDEAVATVGTVVADVSNLKDMSNITAIGKSQIALWGMPDYSRAVTRSGDVTYTETTNGWLELNPVGSIESSATVNLGGYVHKFFQGHPGTDYNHLTNGFIAVPRGWVYAVNNVIDVTIRFIPCIGG